jgi:hypothetical protein
MRIPRLYVERFAQPWWILPRMVLPSRLLVTLAACLASRALAADLTVDDLAKLQREQQKARDAVAKKYGDKPTGEQRRQMVKEQQEAAQAVLDKAGVEQADFVRAAARANGNDVDAVMKAMDKAEAAKKKAGAKGDEKKDDVDQAANDAAEAAEMDKQLKKKK